MTTVFAENAMTTEFFMRTLNRLQGTWYDANGNPAFRFNGNLLNGYKIIGFYDAVGGGSDFGVKIRLLMNGGYRDLDAGFASLREDRNTYHQYMTVNYKTYRRTQQPQYYESVGGVYLGMPIENVYALYGQPDVDQTDRYIHHVGYSKLGLMLDIRNSIVTQITIYTYGDRRFDKSGLSAASSLYEFTNAYGMQREAGIDRANSIGYNEYIWIKDYPKSATLSLYWN